MKPTRFLTSSQPMAEGLGRRCDRSHTHQHLVGGRAAEAALDPIPLIRAILKGMRATTDWEACRRSTHDGQTELIHGSSFNQGTIPFRSNPSEPVPTSQITRTNGGKVEIDFQDWNFKPRYLDEYTGEVLDPELMREATMEELCFFNDKRIWELAELKGVKAIADAFHVRTGWILCNKGDPTTPDMRARLVACEVNRRAKKILSSLLLRRGRAN